MLASLPGKRSVDRPSMQATKLHALGELWVSRARQSQVMLKTWFGELQDRIGAVFVAWLASSWQSLPLVTGSWALLPRTIQLLTMARGSEGQRVQVCFFRLCSGPWAYMPLVDCRGDALRNNRLSCSRQGLLSFALDLCVCVGCFSLTSERIFYSHWRRTVGIGSNWKEQF